MTDRRVIWKYELRPLGVDYLELPEDAEILRVQEQRNKPTLWALVDPEAPKIRTRFLIVLTGEKRRKAELNGGRYLGSFLLYEHDFVGHVFLAPDYPEAEIAEERG